MALVYAAAAPSSECPANVMRNCESPNDPRCTPPPMSPLAREEMRSSAVAAAATACSKRIPFIRSQVGLHSAKHVFVPVTLTFDLQNGRPVWIVGQHVGKISRPYLFPSPRNP